MMPAEALVRDPGTAEQLAPWERDPSRLVSLLMFAFEASFVPHITFELMALTCTGRDIPNNFPPEVRSEYSTRLDGFAEICDRLGLRITAGRIRDVARLINESDDDNGPSELIRERASQAERLLREELDSHKFFHIAPDKVPFWFNRHPLGEAVTEAFPSVRYDAFEASNCIALGRSTAAVFHLMRVLETLLRIAATKLGIQHDSVFTANQQNIIDQIVATIKDRNKTTPRAEKTPDVVAELEFYSRLASKLELAKDAWRNSVMHSRSKYTEEEARTIFDAVGAMMRDAATRLKEGA